MKTFGAHLRREPYPSDYETSRSRDRRYHRAWVMRPAGLPTTEVQHDLRDIESASGGVFGDRGLRGKYGSHPRGYTGDDLPVTFHRRRHQRARYDAAARQASEGS